MLKLENIEIYWTGHAGFKIKGGGKTIYVDPFKIEEPEPADYILITHSHYDHCSRDDLKKISCEKTIIITVPDCISKIGETKLKDLKIIKPQESISFDDLAVEAVRAYNLNAEFHPKLNGWIGFLIDFLGKRLYFAGDTDFVPEMIELKDRNIDIAFLPVGGTYTMDYKSAAEAVNTIKPKIAVPMHYGKIVGT